MKKLLIAAIGVCMLMTSAAHAETKNGWSVNVPSEGTAEICSEEAFEGARSLHVKDNAGEVTASHKIASTGSVKRNFRVTFYAKGSFSEPICPYRTKRWKNPKAVAGQDTHIFSEEM